MDIDQTQKWLIDQISKKTGLYMDGFYLHKILTGQSKNHKIVAAIREILDLQDNSEESEKV